MLADVCPVSASSSWAITRVTATAAQQPDNVKRGHCTGMDRSVDMLKYDLITSRIYLEKSILLERVPYSCVITNATTGLLLMVILIKQNQEKLCPQISKLKSTCKNREYCPRVPESLPVSGDTFPWHRGCRDQKLTRFGVRSPAFQEQGRPRGCQSIAALLCNVYKLLAQVIWHLQEAQISHSTRVATSSCLPCTDLHRGIVQNLQTGFLSFLGVTRFSLYVCPCLLLSRHTYFLSICLHYFIHLCWGSLWDFYS